MSFWEFLLLSIIILVALVLVYFSTKSLFINLWIDRSNVRTIELPDFNKMKKQTKIKEEEYAKAEEAWKTFLSNLLYVLLFIWVVYVLYLYYVMYIK